jgi:hypothetical protein
MNGSAAVQHQWQHEMLMLVLHKDDMLGCSGPLGVNVLCNMCSHSGLTSLQLNASSAVSNHRV